jgi:hypothetical protein
MDFSSKVGENDKETPQEDEDDRVSNEREMPVNGLSGCMKLLEERDVTEVAFESVANLKVKTCPKKEISEAYASRIWREYSSGDDFEHLNFLHLELLRTREKRVLVESSVFGVMHVKVVSLIVVVCVAVITNTNITKVRHRSKVDNTECQIASALKHPSADDETPVAQQILRTKSENPFVPNIDALYE